MPHSVVYLHYVWSTKYRNPILIPSVKEVLVKHIKNNAFRHKIHIVAINGHLDHLHCLVRLKTGQTIDGVIKLIKGESARWFNEHYKNLQLVWQADYFVASVNRSGLERVTRYIEQQEKHHARVSFEEEYQVFINHHKDLEERVGD